ncbi:CLUMA_CG004656, isoform A [Clunio marinus]|uniref:TBC1 domain family member 7 n=1 Tax=Clunio marinus TaxID=568069 RepID=A0A1J1HSD5_9DIPT|nr:CLUMA_CG004656, isoform A [Clunio marinus]
MEDTRNFRSSYYEKVGCRSVEEKKNLEIILKENPVTLSKLRNFAKRFAIPSIHRALLYEVILGVFPVYMESKEFIMNQQREIFNDLKRALEVMHMIDGKTPKSKVIFAMWLLENRSLGSGSNIFKDSPFPLIAEVIIENLEVGEVELYFLSRNFYKYSEEIINEMPKLKQITFQMLEKEDSDLFNNLNNKNILEKLPFERWYPSIFSSILNELSLIRIFDRIVGGSTKIVIFIFIVICSYTRYNLKTQLTCENVIKIIENYPADDSEKSDVIVNKTIDLWHKFSSSKAANR